MILAQAGLASAPGVRAAGGPTQPSDNVLRERLSVEVEGAGDRGFREAEHVLAVLTDIGSTHSRYLKRVAEEASTPWDRSQRVNCHRSNRCSYQRFFDISAGARTKVGLLFNLRLSESTETVCGDLRPDKSCDISAIVYLAGDEAFPHCVGVERIRRGAIRNGWSLFPFRYPDDENVSRYQHEDDGTYLFIRTTNDNRCFRHIYIARIPGI